jgi:hypothetical protein
MLPGDLNVISAGSPGRRVTAACKLPVTVITPRTYCVANLQSDAEEHGTLRLKFCPDTDPPCVYTLTGLLLHDGDATGHFYSIVANAGTRQRGASMQPEWLTKSATVSPLGSIKADGIQARLPKGVSSLPLIFLTACMDS